MLGDVWGEVSSQRYEELTGTSKGQYEQDLLVAPRDTLMDFSGVAPLGTVESVRLDGNNEDVCVVVHFRAHHYPGRRFAWRFRVWPASEPGSDPYSSRTVVRTCCRCISAKSSTKSRAVAQLHRMPVASNG